MFIRIAIPLLCASFFACTARNDQPAEEVKTTPLEINQLIAEVDSEMRAAREATASQNDKIAVIPLEINQRVEIWLRYFAERDRTRFQNYLDRGAMYRSMIESRLAEVGVPSEIYYLAMIESGFSVHAASHASAVGIWQFIKPTGQRYGLIVNPFVDERRDPLRATTAAASYLRDLNNVFQSWFLAMAAYNAGESRIMNAIMKAKSRNFWELVSKKALPRETMDYVPKFIAAAVIGHHPERFGFKVSSVAGYPEVKAIEVPNRVHLPDLAKALKVPLDEIKRVNPHIRKNLIYAESKTYQLWLPSQQRDAIENSNTLLANINIDREMRLVDTDPRPVLKRAAKGSSSHVVRRGETLAQISKKYGVTTTFIKDRNHLPNNRLVAGKRLMLNPKAEPVKLVRTNSYRVQRGDTLIDIAKRHGVGILTLKKINKMRRNHVYAGEIIRLRPRSL